MMMKENLQIAIDGPGGSGKGTLAIALAKKINASHIYTGGMYRALTLKCLNSNIDLKNEGSVLDLLLKTNIKLDVDRNTGLTHIFLDSKDVTEDIFLPKVSNATPVVSEHRSVREEMVRRQKSLADGKKVVMEGRDITTVVLPNADIKIFLTADVNERARRRFNQLKEIDPNTQYEAVIQDVIKRDKTDTERNASPLERTPDSFLVDTTDDTIELTVKKVMDELERCGFV